MTSPGPWKMNSGVAVALGVKVSVGEGDGVKVSVGMSVGVNVAVSVGKRIGVSVTDGSEVCVGVRCGMSPNPPHPNIAIVIARSGARAERRSERSEPKGERRRRPKTKRRHDVPLWGTLAISWLLEEIALWRLVSIRGALAPHSTDGATRNDIKSDG